MSAASSVFCLLALCSMASGVHAQGIDVIADLVIKHSSEAKSNTKPTTSGEKMEPKQVVVWLAPLIPNSAAVAPGHFRLIQKDKMFRPHLLVIPVGSTVAFPNEDPFFHNVFSLFNGKRFDLGLYEAGASRDVNFTHEGVSYIFCNIHPEMSAVILALTTPYYAVSNDEKQLTVHGVPPGTYRMNVWIEGADPAQLQALSRTVDVGPMHDNIGPLTITYDPNPVPHKNKFGENYSDPKSFAY